MSVFYIFSFYGGNITMVSPMCFLTWLFNPAISNFALDSFPIFKIVFIVFLSGKSLQYPVPLGERSRMTVNNHPVPPKAPEDSSMIS